MSELGSLFCIIMLFWLFWGDFDNYDRINEMFDAKYKEVVNEYTR